MDNFWREVFDNQVLWITLLSWAIAQGIKIIIGLARGKKFNFYWVLRTGGLPSAHSAAVVALAVALGKELGFQSPFFAFSVIFALITMFDAQTWRRSIGVQARILNKIMEDFHEGRKLKEKRMKELVGHTPVEIFAGALIGIIVAIVFYM
ncbi:MAG: divergent PAP2 family protein [Candidatus Omnitrophica bacterium]|nr:divergent PAP2 family protein [Candidatus Omnitrophota bacterium]MCF7894704.1 divergent PAP2 family protein [Candidatus Omnitrophota bacterium]